MPKLHEDRQVHIIFSLSKKQWWIDSKTTIYSSLQGFQQVRRLNDGIVLTLTLVSRLAMQASGRYYLFLC